MDSGEEGDIVRIQNVTTHIWARDSRYGPR